jgi:hypothetical protein
VHDLHQRGPRRHLFPADRSVDAFQLNL